VVGAGRRVVCHGEADRKGLDIVRLRWPVYRECSRSIHDMKILFLNT
jgi:hypothetical protein